MRYVVLMPHSYYLPTSQLSISAICHANSDCCSTHLQVLCSAMIIREDADIGYVVVGDIHKKSSCAQIRLAEAVEALATLRCTQLDLLYCGLRLQEPTDDIVDDVPVMNTLVGEFTPVTPADVLHTPRGFVAEVHDAMRVEGLDDDHLASHQNSCSVQLTQHRKDNNNIHVAAGLSYVPLSPDGLLCTMHSKSPCTPTDLQKGSTEGPWFERTIALSVSLVIPADSVTL